MSTTHHKSTLAPLGFAVALLTVAGLGSTALSAENVWSEEAANPFFCMMYQAGDYGVCLSREPRDAFSVTVKVFKDDRPVYEWKGHPYSVFRVLDDRLNYADFSFSTTGGHVVAVDLKTGKQLWRSPLRALGNSRHSQYLNRMNLDASYDHVRVSGNESLGRYFEIKDAKTGKTLGHTGFAEGRPAREKETTP